VSFLTTNPRHLLSRCNAEEAQRAQPSVRHSRTPALALAERVRVIPADLYVAVAELLAMVYRLKNREMRA
jgi:type III secretion system FlhB-like substrate exporter